MNVLMSCQIEVRGLEVAQLEEHLSSRLESLWRVSPYRSRFQISVEAGTKNATARLVIVSEDKIFEVEHEGVSWELASEGALERMKWKLLGWKRGRFSSDVLVAG